MEYIEGIPSCQYKEKWAAELKKQYESALRFIREAGVETERENEKENVIISWVSGQPVIKLIDFGTLARS